MQNQSMIAGLLKHLLVILFIFIGACTGNIGKLRPDTRENQGISSSSADALFFWRISKTESPPSYLLGSIHLLPASFYPLHEVIENAFLRCDKLVLEVDLGKIFSSGQFIEATAIPLEQRLQPETIALLKSKLGEFEISLQQFNHVQPWAMAIFLSALSMKRQGFDPQNGLDFHFYKKIGPDKKIIALETMEQQLQIFTDMSPELSDLFLRYSLLELDLLHQTIQAILNGWKSGDLKTIENLLLSNKEHYPELTPVFEKMIYRRNNEMANKLNRLFKENLSLFIIIGAAHLVGPEGIIEKLREKGYDLTQLKRRDTVRWSVSDKSPSARL